MTTSVAFLVTLGFLLHTSPEPQILGKYSVAYAIFLAVLFVAVIPLFHWLVRACAVTHEWKSSSGRCVVIRPWQKLATVSVLGWGVWLGLNTLADRALNRQALTFNANIFHPYLQNSPTPNDDGLHINRWGFRGDEIDMQKDDDVFRIFVFGGSTVFCGTVPYEQTHCRVLERRLRAVYPQYRVEVQNLGAEWHATEHDTIKLLFLAQDFSPDLAITFHAINDLVRSFSPDMFGQGPYWPDYRHYYGATANLATHGGRTGLLVRTATGYWCSDLRFDQVRLVGPDGHGIRGMRTLFYPKAREIEINEWVSLPAFERNLRDFVSIAQSKRIEVLLATQASLYRDDLTPAEQQLLGFPRSHYVNGQRASLHSMVNGMRQFNDTTRRIASANHVELVDLERRMPKTTEYLYDDVHYTKAGNELIGNAFADEVIKLKLVDRVMRRRREDKNPSPRTQPRQTAGLDTVRR